MDYTLRNRWQIRLVAIIIFVLGFAAGMVAVERAGHVGGGVDTVANGDDAVEVGYSIFESYRRRGYATEVVRALIDWASSEHGIRHFVASISPENEPSLALVRRLGFERTGRHWDEEDGEEVEFELRISDGA